MADNKYKQRKMETQIENWKTAPLSNVERMKNNSRVPIPTDIEVENAKEWVDVNQK